MQLTVYVAQPHVGDRRAKVHDLIKRASEIGAAGGVVLRAHEGFGRHTLHEPTFWHRADETPLLVIFVDSEERIARLMPEIDVIFPHAVAVTRRVQTIRYARTSNAPTT